MYGRSKTSLLRIFVQTFFVERRCAQRGAHGKTAALYCTYLNRTWFMQVAARQICLETIFLMLHISHDLQTFHTSMKGNVGIQTQIGYNAQRLSKKVCTISTKALDF